MKKRTKTLLLTAALSAGLSMPAMAADVQAVLPDFPVTLNGTTIDNSYRQYPLLVYNNITYFPMTYYDCRFLGVETEWTQQSGLKIEKSTLTGAYHQDNMSQKNGKKTTAQLATGKITVNGKSINNSKETYPLLVYRNVTYFPLTWRFAVNEFGWKYNYDNKNGLVIDAGNAKTKSITLKDGRSNIGAYDKFGFAMDKQYLYYEGEKGAIYRRPLANLSDDKQRKKLGEIPYQDMYYTGYYNANIYEEGGHIYYRYHSGGATMGGDYLYLIKGDSSEEILQDTYDEYTDFGEFKIKIGGTVIGGKPASPMTYIGKDGTTKDLGEKGYVFSTNRNAYDKKRQMLYVSAANYENGKLGTGHLYSVDLANGQMKQAIQRIAYDYQVTANNLYYLSNEKPDGTTKQAGSKSYLYTLDLDNNREQYLGEVGSSDTTYATLYTAANNGVYYRNHANGNLLFWNKHTGKTESVNAGFQVNNLCRQNGYVIAQFVEVPKNPNRLMVFAPSGQGMKQVFSSSDCSDGVAVNANGLLLYRLENTNQLVQVQLKK